MTREQWNSCQSPETLLHFLGSQANPHKLRLFAIGCCRRILHLLRDPRSRHLIEVAERYSEDRATDAELRAANDAALAVDPGGAAEATSAVGNLLWHVAGQHWEWSSAFGAAERAANAVMGVVPEPVENQLAVWRAESAAQCDLLRSLFSWDEACQAFDDHKKTYRVNDSR